MQIEQLAPPKTSATTQIVVDDKPVRAADVAQLPDTARAVDGESDEEALFAARTTPTRTTSAEVARAFEVIRSRGQVPTPELIAREIGPDALQAYLQANPGALPEPVLVPRDPILPEPGKGVPGTIIIPPKG